MNTLDSPASTIFATNSDGARYDMIFLSPKKKPPSAEEGFLLRMAALPPGTQLGRAGDGKQTLCQFARAPVDAPGARKTAVFTTPGREGTG
jgi:hypothetical protein